MSVSYAVNEKNSEHEKSLYLEKYRRCEKLSKQRLSKLKNPELLKWANIFYEGLELYVNKTTTKQEPDDLIVIKPDEERYHQQWILNKTQGYTPPDPFDSPYIDHNQSKKRTVVTTSTTPEIILHKKNNRKVAEKFSQLIIERLIEEVSSNTHTAENSISQLLNKPENFQLKIKITEIMNEENKTLLKKQQTHIDTWKKAKPLAIFEGKLLAAKTTKMEKVQNSFSLSTNTDTPTDLAQARINSGFHYFINKKFFNLEREIETKLFWSQAALTFAPLTVGISAAIAAIVSYVKTGSATFWNSHTSTEKLEKSFEKRGITAVFTVNPTNPFNNEVKKLFVEFLQKQKVGEKIKKNQVIEFNGFKFKLTHSIAIVDNAEGEREFYVMHGKNQGTIKSGANGSVKDVKAKVEIRGDQLKISDSSWMVKKPYRANASDINDEIAAIQKCAPSLKPSQLISRNNKFCFFMENSGEENFKNLISKRNTLSYDHILNIFNDLLSQIKIAQDNNYVMYDIKPENITYNSRNQKSTIIDHGGSVPSNAKPKVWQVFYAPPEMYDLSNKDKIMVFSMGAVMAELIVGEDVLKTRRDSGLLAFTQKLDVEVLDDFAKKNPSFNRLIVLIKKMTTCNYDERINIDSAIAEFSNLCPQAPTSTFKN